MKEQHSKGWVKWLIFALTLLVLVSCATNPPAPTEREPIIPDTTKIPDKATRDALTVFDTTTGTMRFNASTPVLDNLKADDVFVSEPTTAAPSGFLRKVVSVRQEGGEVIVETSDAKLTDAVHQGILNVEGKLEASQLRQVVPLTEGASGGAIETPGGAEGLAPQVDFGNGFRFEARLDKVLEAASEDARATVHFKGLVKFDVGYRLLIDIGFLADLDAVEASLNFYEETTLSVDANATGAIKKEIEVARYYFDPITFFIGPVPVVLIPGATVVLGIDGRASVHFDYTFSQSGGFTQGVRWDEDNGWQRLNKNGFDVKHEGPNFEGMMDMRGYARGNLSIMLYGIIGPQAALTAGVRLDVAVPRDPFWILSGFVRGEIAFVIDLLGEEERFAEELFNIERQITSGAAKPPTITILNPNPTIDLGFETDLTQFFKVEDEIGALYSLRSDKDGNLSSLHRFTSEGPRTITITASSENGKTAQAFFTANVINTPPDPPALADEENLSIGQGDEFDLNLKGLPNDKNSGVLPCSTVRWTVLGTDALVTEEGSSNGCSATAIFSEQGTRTVKATVTDPQGLASERTFNITVGAPPAIKSPSVKFITVVRTNGSTPFAQGDTVIVDPDKPSFVPLTASVAIVNPDNVPVTFAWRVVNTSGPYSGFSGTLSETASLTVNVGETAAFYYYDPETFGTFRFDEPICLNGDEETRGYDEAAFQLTVTAAGRTRVKTFNFRCELPDVIVK